MGRDCPRQGPLSRLDGSQCSGRLTRSWGGSMTASWTPDEMMTVEAARRLGNGRVCFVGIGLPSAAANLARLTSGPDTVLIYESGTIGTTPDVLPLSIGDPELCERALTTVSVPEMFRYWLQGGRIDVGFLGAAEIRSEEQSLMRISYAVFCLKKKKYHS